MVFTMYRLSVDIIQLLIIFLWTALVVNNQIHFAGHTNFINLTNLFSWAFTVFDSDQLVSLALSRINVFSQAHTHDFALLAC